MLVTCEERCWDGNKCRLYNLGDQADIDPLSPLAKYFGGWPPGTEIYTKSKGVAGTRVIPGKRKEEVQPVKEEIQLARRGRPPKKEEEGEE